MEEQTLHILNECSSGCKMAIHSMQQILEYVENEKLEQVIMAAERKHKEIAARTAKALTSYGEKGKKPGAAAETFAWLTTEMKMLIRDDSSQIAKIMTNGCNMGIQSIMEVLNENPEADRESKNIAGDLVKAEEQFADELKAFL